MIIGEKRAQTCCSDYLNSRSTLFSVLWLYIPIPTINKSASIVIPLFNFTALTCKKQVILFTCLNEPNEKEAIVQLSVLDNVFQSINYQNKVLMCFFFFYKLILEQVTCWLYPLIFALNLSNSIIHVERRPSLFQHLKEQTKQSKIIINNIFDINMTETKNIPSWWPFLSLGQESSDMGVHCFQWP